MGVENSSLMTGSQLTFRMFFLGFLSMHSVLTSPAAGTVKTLLVGAGDNIAGGDLVVEIE